MDTRQIVEKDVKATPKQMDVEKSNSGGKVLTMRAKDIARKLKSFDHFVYVWGERGRYYLPPKSCITWHYISQILSKEKRLLKLDSVGHQIDIPKVRGSVVNDMFHQVKRSNNLAQYFPDFTDTQNIPRNYFFNV